MSAAEELNVIDRLDQIMLQQVLDDMAKWRASGIEVPNASVNVSSSRLEDQHLISSLSNFDIKPGEITFELVETIFLDEAKQIVDENLARIQEMGIDIDIDDFGTGHASIVGLLRLHPKRIKIDRQFVAPLTESAEQRRLIKSIIDMANHSISRCWPKVLRKKIKSGYCAYLAAMPSKVICLVAPCSRRYGTFRQRP